MSLTGKVAIVTGGGSGIGRASARRLAGAGASVVVADVSVQAGQETAALIGGEAIFIKADVSREAEVAALVDQTVARFGRLDVMFNNAGIDLPQATSLLETSLADWHLTLNVNLKGVFLGARYALPLMMQQRSGVIINTASRAGLAATPQEAVYAASKGGVIALTRQLAVEYAPYNIRVNAICPGVMEHPTRDRRQFLEQRGPDSLAQRAERFAPLIPLGRLCTPADIANAVYYLASDESAYVTGTALIVDGGDLAM